MENALTFRKGFKDGIPIGLGYLSVAFAFGMLSVSKGFPLWVPTIISLTNFTGTGQFAGVDLMYNTAGYAEIALTLLIISLRYSLMSVSLSQKLSDDVTFMQRLLIAFGNTDEIFGVSMQQKGLLNYKYMLGIILSSFSGWVGGTFLGSIASSALPEFLVSALGIALYAMFIAIIIPPAKESRTILGIILTSVAISCAFRYIPLLSGVSGGWVIIVAGVVSAGIFALIRPVGKEQEDYDAD